ncbi:hypothetical protein FP2506_08876 [Fulvimarina pelagi HTCC2506]|uniref:Uncharacterized protein n=1 Tax=Fulvimarina pelagi HTCC2506 TaxID=314231 RepID=Q0G5X1_9HYPH|nr:hypothetical protein FP2506_08876 [Fulvimarina pelagi HTCC2506]
MLASFIRNACLAAAVSLGAIGASAAPAAANGIGFGITIGSGHVPSHYRNGRGYRAHHSRGHRAYGCSPHRAVRKANRIGVHRARVIRAGHRGIAVAGRLRGDRVIVRFGNRPNCPVRHIRGL